jgi:WD40 repeat protein
MNPAQEDCDMNQRLVTVKLEETLWPARYFKGGFSMQLGGSKLVLRCDEPTGDPRFIHRVWDYLSRHIEDSVREPEQYLWAAALSPNGQFMAYGYSTMTVVSLPSGEVYRRWYNFDEDRMARPVFHPDGRRIVTTSGPRIHIWDMHKPSHPELPPEAEFTGHIEFADGQYYCSDRLTCLILSADGRYALSGDRRGGAIVWDVDTCQIVRRLPRAPLRKYMPPREVIRYGLKNAPNITDQQPVLLQPGVDISSVAFFPDVSKVVVAEQEYSAVSVYEVSTGRRLARYETSTRFDGANSLAVSPDGQYILLGFYHAPILWDWRKDLVAAELLAHRELDPKAPGDAGNMPYGGALSVSFAPDGKHIITGGNDGTLRIWSVDAHDKSGDR